MYSINYLRELGVKIIGSGHRIQISKYARLYNPKNLILHDNIRIDDFVILSGKGIIEIQNYVHIANQSSITSSKKITLSDFSGLSSGVRLYGSTDDYSGMYLTNPTVPSKYLANIQGDVHLGKHVIIGAGSIVLPNVELAEGTAIGALSLVNRNTEPWKIYAGVPCKAIKDRKQNCLQLERELLKEKVWKENIE